MRLGVCLSQPRSTRRLSPYSRWQLLVALHMLLSSKPAIDNGNRKVYNIHNEGESDGKEAKMESRDRFPDLEHAEDFDTINGHDYYDYDWLQDLMWIRCPECGSYFAVLGI